MKVIGIDPGVSAFGFAMWDSLSDNRIDYKRDPMILAPSDTFIIDTAETYWQDAIWHLSRKAMRKIALMNPDENTICTCEFPVVHGGAKGRAAAAGGDVTHLAAQAAMLAGMLYQEYGMNTNFVEPIKWKGNMPKEICWERLRRPFGDKDQNGKVIRSHALDAVGVGLFGIDITLDDSLYFCRNLKSLSKGDDDKAREIISKAAKTKTRTSKKYGKGH